MILIGFGNKARHGKDSCAQAISDFYRVRNVTLSGYAKPIYVRTFKFATALYAEVNEFLKNLKASGQDSWKDSMVGESAVLPIPEWVTPEPHPEVNELAPYGKHPKLLQWWGTNFRRNYYGENYWIERTFKNIVNVDVALLTDVRFPNEAQAVVDKGGYTVKVTRYNSDGSEFVAPDRPADHVSEVALDNWNWDFKIAHKEGQQAWRGEQAVTLAEYLRALGK